MSFMDELKRRYILAVLTYHNPNLVLFLGEDIIDKLQKELSIEYKKDFIIPKVYGRVSKTLSTPVGDLPIMLDLSLGNNFRIGKLNGGIQHGN